MRLPPRACLLICCLLVANLSAAVDAGDEELAQRLLKRAQKALVEGVHEDALRRYQTITKLYPLTLWAETAWWQIARLQNHLGDPQAAFDALQRLITGHPGQFTKAHEEQFLLARGILDACEQRARRQGLEPRRSKQLDETEREMLTAMLEQVIKNGPQSEIAIQAQHVMALILERAGELGHALELHEGFLESHPDHELADDAACQAAYIRFKSWKSMKSSSPRDRTRAHDSLVWFLARYPQSERAALARACLAEVRQSEQKELEILARYYEAQGKPDAAAIYYRELALKFPELARLESPLRQKILDAVRQAPTDSAESVGPTAADRP
jgi:outer membrane protein assembly factor BamD (BamD/ComL family)